jgi:lysine 6-dehydrogenase
MRIAVAGAGKMAAGIVFDFLQHDPPEELLLLDQSSESLAAMQARFPQARFPRTRLHTELCDLSAAPEVVGRVRGYDGLLSAASYRLNAILTRVAIDEHLAMVDLGGNPEIVAQQLAMDGEARAAGVTIIPDCGLAPGLVSILAADGIRRVGEADSVQIRVGGLPVDPQPPLHYAISFSAEGLVNEYLEDAEVLREGRPATVAALTELEELEFPPPFGTLEAFQTAGGSSTLPRTYAGRVRRLDYKTIRYPGHCRILQALFALGFADEAAV